MQQTRIERLTSEQEALFPVYLDKWRAIALQPGPIARHQARQIDSWREYTLLRINIDFAREPICLLKTICPSTGFIHMLRVLPDLASAREAISWVNWGTDPEEFLEQT